MTEQTEIKQYAEEYKRRVSMERDIPYDDLMCAEHMGYDMGYIDGVAEFEKALKDIKSISDREWEYGVDEIANGLKKKLKYMRDREGNKIGYTKEKTTKPLVMSMPEFHCCNCFEVIKAKDTYCSRCGAKIEWKKNFSEGGKENEHDTTRDSKGIQGGKGQRKPDHDTCR